MGTLFIDLVRVSIDLLLSYHVFFSPQKKIITCFFQEQHTTGRQAKAQEASQASKPRIPPKKEKNTSTSAFQSGGSLPFPPGSNCLFSSLARSFSSGLRLIFLQTVFYKADGLEVWLLVCVSITSSSRENNILLQIRTHADEQTTVDSAGLFHLPVRETLRFGCFKTRTSRW